MGNPRADCPLEKYRNKPLKNKLKIVEQFSNDKIEKIIQHHKECLLRRVS